MNKTSTTKNQNLNFLLSILSCLVIFSCADPNNNNPTNEPEPKEPENTEITHSAMIGTWVNPDDNSDTIIISDTVVTFSPTAIYKIDNRRVENDYLINISTAKIINNKFVQDLKDYCIKYDIDFCSVKKNENEYYTWLEKIDIEFANLDYFKKEPSLFFGTFDYTYLWLDNGKLNVRYIDDFNSELHGSECVYIKKGSSSQNTPSTLTESDLIGSYTISEANGSTFTFASDGTWTYKYNSSTTNGTWSVSDSELTINYSLGGYSSTAIFTVNVSDDTYTITGKSGDYTTIISSAFKITEQTALENGVATLVKQ